MIKKEERIRGNKLTNLSTHPSLPLPSLLFNTFVSIDYIETARG